MPSESEIMKASSDLNKINYFSYVQKASSITLFILLYPPPKRSFKGVYCFHVVRPSVRPCIRTSVRPSVTFSFFNTLIS